jgi:cytochrome c553
MKKLIIALFCGVVSLSATAGGNVANGKAIALKQNCAACHGADYNKPIDPSYPKLAGQHSEYLEHALKTYKRGEGRAGRSNAIMMGQVKSLTNDDLADLAAYLHSLPGDLVLKR